MTIREMRAALRRRAGARGQAMVETSIMMAMLFVWGASMTHFFPDSLNALQVYMDSFYFMLSLPVP